MIMSYLAFKQPLPPDKIGTSLNEKLALFLENEDDIRNQQQVDEVFDLYEEEYQDEDDLSASDDESQTKRKHQSAFLEALQESGSDWEELK